MMPIKNANSSSEHYRSVIDFFGGFCVDNFSFDIGAFIIGQIQISSFILLSL